MLCLHFCVAYLTFDTSMDQCLRHKSGNTAIMLSTIDHSTLFTSCFAQQRTDKPYDSPNLPQLIVNELKYNLMDKHLMFSIKY